jgi:hypothetical protein
LQFSRITANQQQAISHQVKCACGDNPALAHYSPTTRRHSASISSQFIGVAHQLLRHRVLPSGSHLAAIGYGSRFQEIGGTLIYHNMEMADARTLGFAVVGDGPETDYLLNIQVVSNWRD